MSEGISRFKEGRNQHPNDEKLPRNTYRAYLYCCEMQCHVIVKVVQRTVPYLNLNKTKPAWNVYTADQEHLENNVAKNLYIHQRDLHHWMSNFATWDWNKSNSNSNTILAMPKTEFPALGKFNQQSQRDRFLHSSILNSADSTEIEAYKVSDSAEDGFLESMGYRLEMEDPFLCKPDDFYENLFADPVTDAEDGFLENMNSRLDIGNPFLCESDEFHENWFANPDTEMIIEDYHEVESELDMSAAYFVENPLLCESYVLEGNCSTEPDSLHKEHHELESGSSKSTTYVEGSPLLCKHDNVKRTSGPTMVERGK